MNPKQYYKHKDSKDMIILVNETEDLGEQLRISYTMYNVHWTRLTGSKAITMGFHSSLINNEDLGNWKEIPKP